MAAMASGVKNFWSVGGFSAVGAEKQIIARGRGGLYIEPFWQKRRWS
jgi:hypothetical protein